MISEKNKYIFIHIPKCAGLSIEDALLKHEGHNILANAGGEHSELLESLLCTAKTRHLTLKEIIERFELSEEDLKSYYIFTMVRNPFDRLVSAFCYSTATKNKLPFLFKDLNERSEKTQKDSKEDKVREEAITIFNESMQKKWDKEYQGQNLITKFQEFTKLENYSKFFGKTLQKSQIDHLSIDGKTVHPQINFIGKYENLENEWVSISKKLKIKQRNLWCRNKTVKPSYKEFYTKEIIKKVETLYKKDFEAFNYDPSFHN